MSRNHSQKQRVLSLLRNGGSLTSLEAKLYFNVPNLYLHISKLRKEGYNIEGHEIDTNNGKRMRYEYPRWKQLFDNTGKVLANWFR